MGDSDEEGRASWIAAGKPIYQEGAGYVDPMTGQLSNMVPSVPATPAPMDMSSYASPKMMSPGTLGYDAAMQQQFANAGVTEIPEWMKRFTNNNRDLSDLVSTYKTISDPNLNWSSFGTTGKAETILRGMGYKVGDDGSLGYSGPAQTYFRGEEGSEGRYEDAYPGYNTTGTFGDADKQFFMEQYLNRKTRPNIGAWEQSISPAVQGIGSIASVVAGLGALGAFSAPAAGAIEGGTGGAAVGGGAGGLGMGADLGYSAAQLAPGGMQGGIAGGSASAGSWLGDAIAAGQAAGADVGMGAGTSWLTDLGLPASYGNDLGALLSYGGDQLAGLDWGSLLNKVINIGNLLGGGTGLTGTVPMVIGGGSGGTSAPQTSQIIPTQPMGQGTPIAPATMPTGSVMGAFGNKDSGNNDYKKYFSNLF